MVVPRCYRVVGNFTVQAISYASNQVVIPSVNSYILSLDFAIQLTLYNSPIDSLNLIQLTQQIVVRDYLLLPCLDVFRIPALDKSVDSRRLL